MRPRGVQSTMLILALATHATAQSCEPYWLGTGSPIIIGQQNGGMVVHDDGSGPRLYAAGSVGGHNRVARWNGHAWQMLTSGLPTFSAIEIGVLEFSTGAKLFVRGTYGGGVLMYYWSGVGWEPESTGMGQAGAPLLAFDDGSGEAVWGITYGVNPNNRAVGRWDGSQWVIIGEANPNVRELILFDDGMGPRLHVAGSFTSLSGTLANRIARWTGNNWEPLGLGVTWSSTPTGMVVHDDGDGDALYVANVQNAGGLQVDRIARWDGHNWSNIGGGGINAVGIVTLHGLGSYDDGTGPALFVGGYMSYAGNGVPVRGIARYKSGVWDSMLGGTSGTGIPNQFAVYDYGNGPSLFVGGGFNTVGSGAPGANRGIAEWVGCFNQCYANCSRSTTEPRLTVDDFTCFIDKFAYGDPYVDCNQDGQRTIDDFACFINAFARGCP